MAAQGTSTPASSPPSTSNSQSSSTLPLSHLPAIAPAPSLPPQPSHHQEEAAANNGVKEDVNVKSDTGVKLELIVSPKEEEFDVMKATEPETVIPGAESEESIEKFKKYEADYAHRLIAKYFSNKDIYGALLAAESFGLLIALKTTSLFYSFSPCDDIFEVNFPIDDASIRASRWPCMRSYADPLQSYTQLRESTSPPDTGMAGNIPNGLGMEE